MKIAMLASVAVGGALGATARYVITFLGAQRFAGHLHWGTFIVNVIGCFLIGSMYELSEGVALSPTARAMISTGLIGAFTTFSTFALETINLIRQREWLPALLNVVLSVALGFIACVIGIAVVRLVTRLHAVR